MILLASTLYVNAVIDSIYIWYRSNSLDIAKKIYCTR